MSKVVEKLMKFVNCQNKQHRLLGIALYSQGKTKMAERSPIIACKELKYYKSADNSYVYNYLNIWAYDKRHLPCNFL